jgi:UPF0271 protein
MDELIPDSLSYARFNASRDSGHLTVRRPTSSSLSAAKEASSRVGDVGVLSNADHEVLALALDLKAEAQSPTLVSDDYAIQNVADILDIEHASLSTFGITKRFDWIYYCPACFRRYPPESIEEACRVCGTSLKRKVVRQEPVLKKKVRAGLQ